MKQEEAVALEIIRGSSIEPKEVEWLWYPYIPFGKVTIIQGDPGEGKSTCILALAALLTRGEELPFTGQRYEPMDVIYQNTEDDAEDTVIPRFRKAGGDPEHLLFINEQKQALTFTDKRIEEAILETGARLLIFDPLASYIGENMSLNSANEVRGRFNHLIDAAKNTGCAIVIIGHMNKMVGVKAMYRTHGSIDVVAAARSVLVIGQAKGGEPDQRILAVQKCNLAEKGASILFSVEDGKVTWISEVEMTADELVGASGAEHGRPSVKQEKAATMLKEILANGAVPQKKIEEMLREHGISHSTAKIVKRRLGIESVKPAGQHNWYWQLPEEKKDLEEPEVNEEGNNLTGTQ